MAAAAAVLGWATFPVARARVLVLMGARVGAAVVNGVGRGQAGRVEVAGRIYGRQIFTTRCCYGLRRVT